MKNFIRNITSLTLALALSLVPTFALADSGHGNGQSDERHQDQVSHSLPQTPGIAEASSHHQFDSDEWRGGTDNGVGNSGRNMGLHRGEDNDHGVHSGPGSVNGRHGENDDEDCDVSSDHHSSLEDSDDDEECAVNPNPDVTAPVISAITAAPAVTSATIAWTTDEPSTSRVFFSTVAPLDVNASTTLSVTSATLVTGHSISLTGLAASTTYQFAVRSADGSGNVTTSSVFTFTTLPTTVTTIPILSSIAAAPGVTTSAVSFTTDVPSDGTVFFGTTSPLDVNASTTLSVTNVASLTNHVFSLINLAANTTYFYIVKATNAVGSAVSSMLSFTTAADTVAPVLTNIVATTTAGTATFTWTTNEPATSKVSFGTTTPLDLLTAASVSSPALVTSHSISVSGLATSTTHHFVVQSTDAANNSATSSDISLLIP
ncbi:MAG: fibronectin type III domain-containing protein [Minisyncoccia bacterium]